jgi:hypothetical protein
VDKSPLRRRLSDTGSPVRLPIEGFQTQPTQDDPYLLPCVPPDDIDESLKRPYEEGPSFETSKKLKRFRRKVTPSPSDELRKIMLMSLYRNM